MPERKPFIFTDKRGGEYTLHGEYAPVGYVEGWFELQTRRNGHDVPGPNYDHTWNSIEAAMLFAEACPIMIWKCWVHLWERNKRWVNGDDLSIYGNSALRRVRDLRKLGWPLRERPPVGRKGTWDYRFWIDLDPPKRKIRLVRTPPQ